MNCLGFYGSVSKCFDMGKNSETSTWLLSFKDRICMCYIWYSKSFGPGIYHLLSHPCELDGQRIYIYLILLLILFCMKSGDYEGTKVTKPYFLIARSYVFSNACL